MIRVTYVQSSTAKELSPITDPSSTTSVPQVEQPRPTEEPPKEHAASMPVIPDSEEDITPPVRPRPQPAEIAEPEEPVVTQPLPEPEPEVETETEQEPITGEIITSETGREVYIDDQAEPEPIEPEIEPVSTQDPEQLPDDVVDSEPSSDHIEQEPEPGIQMLLEPEPVLLGMLKVVQDQFKSRVRERQKLRRLHLHLLQQVQ